MGVWDRTERSAEELAAALADQRDDLLAHVRRCEGWAAIDDQLALQDRVDAGRHRMIRVTIAFDVDGTLETSSGPVTLAMLEELGRRGAKVAIVSPSAARPQRKEWPEFIDGAARQDNLRRAAAALPADLYLYVSDNGDTQEAQVAGFIYVDRNAFRL